MNESDITVIIQGSQTQNSHSIQNLNNYFKLGCNVIISCWQEDNFKNLSLNDQVSRCKIIETQTPQYNVINKKNIYLQCMSTLKGLENTNSQYVIKVRSDEKYTNLQPIITKLKNNPEKIITNNIYFRSWDQYKFHPSDHIIAAKSNTLLAWFATLKYILETDYTIIQLTPEQIMCMALIRYKENIPHFRPEYNDKDMFKKYFDVVPAEDLGDYIWHDSYGYHTSYDPTIHPIKKIEDI